MLDDPVRQQQRINSLEKELRAMRTELDKFKKIVLALNVTLNDHQEYVNKRFKNPELPRTRIGDAAFVLADKLRKSNHGVMTTGDVERCMSRSRPAAIRVMKKLGEDEEYLYRAGTAGTKGAKRKSGIIVWKEHPYQIRQRSG